VKPNFISFSCSQQNVYFFYIKWKIACSLYDIYDSSYFWFETAFESKRYWTLYCHDCESTFQCVHILNTVFFYKNPLEGTTAIFCIVSPIFILQDWSIYFLFIYLFVSLSILQSTVKSNYSSLPMSNIKLNALIKIKAYHSVFCLVIKDEKKKIQNKYLGFFLDSFSSSIVNY
jgi:hypothetical protein